MPTSSQEPTEHATPKRLREARKRGQVPRSRELSTLAVVGAVVLFISSSGEHLAQASTSLMREALHVNPDELADTHRLPMFLFLRLGQGLLAMAPIFVGTAMAALAAPSLLGGWNFSIGAIAPDFSRVNPAAGIKRVLSTQGLFELAKSIAKFALIGTVGSLFLWKHLLDMIGLGTEAPRAAIGHVGALIAGLLTWLIGALALIAAIDAPYQLWHYLQQLRMTRQEVRDEFKESEGRPEVKQRIRRMQQEISKRRMLEKIPTADVVVVNPTHYAVALKYEAGVRRAPIVVAKGAGIIADAIRELAMKNRVPLVSAPPLARALYRSVDLDQEIPVPLYAAVAKILTFIYQLRDWSDGPRPKLADIGEVPGGEPDPPER